MAMAPELASPASTLYPAVVRSGGQEVGGAEIRWGAMVCCGRGGMRWDAMGCGGMRWDVVGCGGMQWGGEGEGGGVEGGGEGGGKGGSGGEGGGDGQGPVPTCPG